MQNLAIITFAFSLGAMQTAQAKIADVICDDSARLERQLLGLHGVQKQGRGLRGPDTLMEMWVDPSTGDWTLVQNYTNGTSCIVALGQNWEDLTPVKDPA